MEGNRKNTRRYALLLVLAAFIWGTAFVAQSMGMDYIGPCTFNATRSFIGSVALLPVIWFFSRRQGRGAEKSVWSGRGRGRRIQTARKISC